MLRLDKKVH